MKTLSSKIAYYIIIAGLFIIAAFVAANYQNLTTSLYIMALLLSVYVFFFGFAVGQQFTAPVKKLLKEVNKLGTGDLKSRFYTRSRDEIGQLSNTFNKIAAQLEETYAEKERIKQLVGVKVEAQTHALEEVIHALEQKVQNKSLELQKIMGDLEKVKEYSRVKESELVDLKDQIVKLKKKTQKKVSKAKEVQEEI